MSWGFPPRRGEESPNASTNNATADQIRADRKKGLKYRELAEKYGVSESTIQRIIENRAYRS